VRSARVRRGVFAGAVLAPDVVVDTDRPGPDPRGPAEQWNRVERGEQARVLAARAYEVDAGESGLLDREQTAREIERPSRLGAAARDDLQPVRRRQCRDAQRMLVAGEDELEAQPRARERARQVDDRLPVAGLQRAVGREDAPRSRHLRCGVRERRKVETGGKDVGVHHQELEPWSEGFDVDGVGRKLPVRDVEGQDLSFEARALGRDLVVVAQHGQQCRGVGVASADRVASAGHPRRQRSLERDEAAVGIDHVVANARLDLPCEQARRVEVVAEEEQRVDAGLVVERRHRPADDELGKALLRDDVARSGIAEREPRERRRCRQRRQRDRPRHLPGDPSERPRRRECPGQQHAEDTADGAAARHRGTRRARRCSQKPAISSATFGIQSTAIGSGRSSTSETKNVSTA